MASGTTLARRSPLPSVTRGLACAIVASVLLHAALLLVSAGSRGGAVVNAPDEPLKARLTLPDVAASLVPLPLMEPLVVPRALPTPLPSLKLEEPVPSPPEVPPATDTTRAGGARSGIGQSVAVMLRDRTRLGDLQTRTQTEFPIEIDRPPILEGKIVARYPPAALAAGRDDTVVAWVVVNELGQAAEIEIAEGGEAFAEEVRLALRAARFRPAEDKLKPIRYPLAFEFEFRSGANTVRPDPR